MKQTYQLHHRDQACAEADNMAGAWHSLSEMIKADVEANIISGIIVIKACAEAHDMAGAEHWLSEMMSADVGANITSRSIVIKARAEALLPEGWQSGT